MITNPDVVLYNVYLLKIIISHFFQFMIDFYLHHVVKNIIHPICKNPFKVGFA